MKWMTARRRVALLAEGQRINADYLDRTVSELYEEMEARLADVERVLCGLTPAGISYSNDDDERAAAMRRIRRRVDP